MMMKKIKFLETNFRTLSSENFIPLFITKKVYFFDQIILSENFSEPESTIKFQQAAVLIRKN